ncbi:hypothetical protein EVAR_98939_1 [Eumeta japonica]|uniref:Uncharacterized protein n=1 Tax=Eumeta variegata TaxID=151549 RepID=A0A4C1TCL9_EUMVA|nr:hypothetical protein EVAR_98939_1 [Eumeta japonica]
MNTGTTCEAHTPGTICYTALLCIIKIYIARREGVKAVSQNRNSGPTELAPAQRAIYRLQLIYAAASAPARDSGANVSPLRRIPFLTSEFD